MTKMQRTPQTPNPTRAMNQPTNRLQHSPIQLPSRKFKPINHHRAMHIQPQRHRLNLNKRTIRSTRRDHLTITLSAPSQVSPHESGPIIHAHNLRLPRHATDRGSDTRHVNDR